MQKHLTLLSLVICLLSVGFFFSLFQDQRAEISELQNTLEAWKKNTTALQASVQMLQLKQARLRPTIINRPVQGIQTNSLKDQVFKLLYEINGNASSENASVAKKIRYLPGQLLVQDFEVILDDRFFELLGILLDEDAVKKVELPAPAKLDKNKKANLRFIKKELVQFGLSSDLLAVSLDGQFRININHFKD